MNFTSPAMRLFGAPVILSLLATPVLAATQHHGPVSIPSPSQPTIELIYPEFAQVGGDEIGGGSGGADDGGGITPLPRTGPAEPVSDERTDQIVEQLSQIERICEFMGDEYRIACFAQTYRELADTISGRGEYAEAKDVLLDAARELDKLVRRNIDRQKPRLRARLSLDDGQTVSTPPIAAVRSDRAASLNNNAANILEEAETVLLRSAGSDAARGIHFQRIAAAVGSNKVLLRSS